MEYIARIQTDFPSKFGIPRQSLIADGLYGTIVFEKQFRNPDALRGLEEFSHIWLIWEFSEVQKQEWAPTVRPPRLGGNERVGVFASRSPFRPNSLGLSVVKLEKIEYDTPQGAVLFVSGVDLMNNTPIFDIKPYVPYVDSVANANGGFTEKVEKRRLNVAFPPNLLQKFPKLLHRGLLQLLALDPRPSYQHDENRIYGLPFANFDVKFCVKRDCLHVVDVVDFK